MLSASMKAQVCFAKKKTKQNKKKKKNVGLEHYLYLDFIWILIFNFPPLENITRIWSLTDMTLSVNKELARFVCALSLSRFLDLKFDSSSKFSHITYTHTHTHTG